MREIKFRAWDGSQMVYNTTPYARLENKNILCIGSCGYNRRENLETSIDCEAIAVMQYSGLKDKNGKEIYEGDMVVSENQAEEPLPISFNGHHGLRVMIGKNQMTRADALYGEVIGNIYEHPHLLDNDK
jgi:uncharacterized phage protein (TIGR01671 family)